LQYIDKVEVEFEDTAETFMGGLVHEVLQKLYEDLNGGFLNTKERLIEFYEREWESRWSDDIKVVRNDALYYQNLGRNFIDSYYEKHKPFNQAKTLGLETMDFLALEDGNQYHIRIDRLSSDGNGNYFVCDYKTNNKLKSQWEVDEDRQLAMYSLWVKEKFKDCKDVKLIWYFLAHNTELVSERSDEQLRNLKVEIQNNIKEIEACENFSTNKTPLCDWCAFKSICPEWTEKRFKGAVTLKNFLPSSD
jgi:putative RecB family exonuclease